jgi:N-acetylmuramoyl-L-alanine amidase
MVSDFIQKNVTILRILIIITSLIWYVTSTLKATDVNVLLNKGVNNSFNHSYVETATPAKPKIKKKNLRVVIDAGHGGHDSGAVGKNAMEKDLNLKMALKLEDVLKRKYPDMEVLQTRTSDVFIPLFRRIQYANEENADIFISIHCNYISNTKTRGTETFVMGVHRSGENLEVAKRENASILLEKNYEANYDGFDPNSAEGHIVVSMYQNNYLDKSIELAANIEEQFGKNHMSKSRGVKQAAFAVLRRSSMPAILVETGFLSNEIEEAYLISEEGQQAIVTSIANGFEKYFTNNQSKDQNLAFEKNKTVVEIEAQNVVASNNSNKASKQDKKLMDVTEIMTSDKNAQKFKVQIAAIKNESADLDTPELRKIGALTVKKANDVNKYLVGDFITRESAEIAREKLKNMGYAGAFIVPIAE